MSELQADLVQRLEALPDVRVGFWKETQLLCVFYREKEVAHFQNENELDVRLTRAIIKREGISPPAGSLSHPTRSPNSKWIVLGFDQPEQLDEIVRLVKMAFPAPPADS